VRGRVASLGADCVETELTADDIATLGTLLAKAGIEADPKDFRRYGSARKLYHFKVDHADAY
jgi:methylamine---glutamate N-methyltransferase subunit B